MDRLRTDEGGHRVVTHIVIFTWVAQVQADRVDAMRRALDDLASDLSHLTRLQHGPDLRIRDGNGDYALIATFADRAGWNAYQEDPRHKAFVDGFVTPILASRLTVQF